MKRKIKQRRKRMSLDDRRWYIASRKLRRYDEAMKKIYGRNLWYLIEKHGVIAR